MIVIEMENGKKIKLELYPEIAPISCENFEKLVKEDEDDIQNAEFALGRHPLGTQQHFGNAHLPEGRGAGNEHIDGNGPHTAY